MDTIQKARQVIADAEAALRDLISKALVEQRYSEVKEIAGLADKVARILQSGDIQLSTSPPPSPSDTALRSMVQHVMDAPTPSYSDKPAKRVRRRIPQVKKGYPRFVRDDDKLVKVGWSKKNKAEYEHRVPRETILTFVRHLDENVEESTKFDIDSLFPVSDGSGGEVPGYQIYVIIAWLREVDVIEKLGRDGYVIRDKSVLRGKLDEQWNAIHAKST